MRRQVAMTGKAAKQARRKSVKHRAAKTTRGRTPSVAELQKQLAEALEQQAASAEVLRVISKSPGELEPVFQAMLENAVHLCDAKFGTLFRFDGKLLHRAAGFGTPLELVAFQKKRGPFAIDDADNAVTVRMFREKAVVQILDAQQSAKFGPAAIYGGARSIVAVPMLRDNEVVGSFIIYRREVRPFTDKQVELVDKGSRYQFLKPRFGEAIFFLCWKCRSAVCDARLCQSMNKYAGPRVRSVTTWVDSSLSPARSSYKNRAPARRTGS